MIDLQLFGGLAIGGQDTSSETPAPRRRALALLAFIASAAPQPVPRDKLLALLWPESDSIRARNSLRQTVFALRRHVNEDLFLPESPSGLQLDPERFRVDLWEFRDALAREAPAEAVSVYRGPFLDGFHVPGLSALSQWIDTERERVERQHIAALDALARCATARANFDEAVMWRRRQAEADPLSSKAALALLHALAETGDRASALRYAASHERLIRQELEVDPDPVVTEFVASLRADAVAFDMRATPSKPREWIATPPRAATPATSHAAMLTPADGVELDRDGAPVAAALPGVMAANRSQSHVRKPAWFAIAALVLLAGTAMAGRWATSGRAESTAVIPPILVLGSGSDPVSGRDPMNRIVACSGPACPTDPLPQDAYVVAPNSAYPAPAAGTHYIGPVPDATNIVSPGYRCCTLATFERTFPLPANAIAATITVSTLADNAASVEVNGEKFGAQTDTLASMNFDSPSQFTTTFVPDPSGVNHLRITLWDGGGALGLQYVATVTYQTDRAHAQDSATRPK
ncbi:MAG TPA: BTAD domain-containing putative transcriptional regulator [Gemmatimonadaceae bacterium]|nr:BTAD domain-containing putative transcriptional regulator [Gemmatimonadaceae bacterium]